MQLLCAADGVFTLSFVFQGKDEGRCGSFHKLSNLLPSFTEELIPGGVGGERIDFQASGT